jgi:hypothetical protein
MFVLVWEIYVSFQNHVISSAEQLAWFVIYEYIFILCVMLAKMCRFRLWVQVLECMDL